MADETITTLQAGESDQQSAPAATAPDNQQPDTDKKPRTIESLEEENARLRKESASFRTRAKEYETAKTELDELKAKDLSETERQKKEIEALKAANADALSRAQNATVRSIAADLGFADPKDAVRLLESVPDDEADLEDALKALLKAKPYLAKSQGSGIPDTGKGGKPATSADKSAEKQQHDAIISRNSFLAKRLGSQKV